MLPNKEQENICLYFISYYIQCLCHLEFYTSKNTIDNFTQKRCIRNTKAPGVLSYLRCSQYFC
jgi:hypothetical protein